MTVFATALATLHADTNIAQAATFTPAVGAAVAVGIILSSPNDEFGQVRALARQASLPVAALATVPAIGDALAITGTTYRIADVQTDVHGLSYTLSLAPST